MVLWIIESYILFACVMILASVIITLINYWLLRSSLSKLRKFADNSSQVKVMRNGNVLTINSINIRPGDVLFYNHLMNLPCDSVLIEGTVLVNESSLTGESIPITKTSIEYAEGQDQLFSISNSTKGHILYEGTHILQTRGTSVMGVVLRTGYTSFRGRILREMLYPKKISFQFFRKGIIFLLILMCIGIAAYLIELNWIIEKSIPQKLIIARFFDTALWMIPPALPIFFSICQTIALVRLNKINIIATDPVKVVVASDVSIMCFDKTGTITQDTLDVSGFSDEKCKIFSTSFPDTGDSSLLQKGFATCHSLCSINGSLCGDSLDIKMFQFSNYVLLPESESDINISHCLFTVQTASTTKQTPKKLAVIRTWEFESQFQRMTCISRDVSKGETHIFMKGSPETVRTFCNPSTLNETNYKTMLDQFTSQGLRVIAFACLPIDTTKFHNISTIKREEIEQNLDFLGFFVLENPLKPDTPNVIKRLREARIACKVISGDNILTTVQCAKQANFFEGDDIVVCESMATAHRLHSNEPVDINQILSTNQKQFQVAITGSFLTEFLVTLPNPSRISALLKNTTVFSRFKPEQKAQIIHMFQTILNVKVGMIGDGANDCSAIKQADIGKLSLCERFTITNKIFKLLLGISFTKTDASYSSPFSSSGTSLNCVEDILCEGRCTLTNMIDCYKYYLVVSVYKYIIASIMILEYSYLSSLMIIVINYAVSIPFLLAIAFNKPLNKLTGKSISNMLDVGNFACLYGNIIIAITQFLVQYFHLRNQTWFQPITNIGSDDEYQTISMTCHVMFLAITMSFIFSILALYASAPTKQRLYQNKALTILLILIFIITSLYYLAPKSMGINSGFKLSQEVANHNDFLGVQYVISIAFGTLMILYEELLIKPIFRPNRQFCPIPHPLESL